MNNSNKTNIVFQLASSLTTAAILVSLLSTGWGKGTDHKKILGKKGKLNEQLKISLSSSYLKLSYLKLLYIVLLLILRIICTRTSRLTKDKIFNYTMHRDGLVSRLVQLA